MTIIATTSKSRIPNYVQVIARYFPDISVHSVGSTYAGIVWENPDDRLTASQSVLDSKILAVAKEGCIVELTTESNVLQLEAISRHTESLDPLQNTVYTIKFRESVKYVDLITANGGDATGVPVPPMIQKECDSTGEPPQLLAGYIVQNYENANKELLSFIGELEGKRRIHKQHILACVDVAELTNLAWIIWPTFQSDVSSSIDE